MTAKEILIISFLVASVGVHSTSLGSHTPLNETVATESISVAMAGALEYAKLDRGEWQAIAMELSRAMDRGEWA